MFIVAALAVALSGVAGPARATIAPRPAGDRITGPAALAALVARAGVPSFSRQTKLACGACHYGFPQLTPFGRMFKLNGYTMTGLPMVTAQADSASRLQLNLLPIGPLSIMAEAAVTNVAKGVPGTQSTTSQFPQQLSLFASGAVSDKMGIFSQITYSDQSAKFSIDNTDVRYATHKTINDKDVLLGLTLHNNPTVQDVWNSTPAWGYPFIGSAVAPHPASATLVEGALAQSVVGLGAYTLYNNTLYAELTGYLSAPQGAVLPADSTAKNTPRNLSPYWRLGLQHQFSNDYLMVGTFGLRSEIYPAGIIGATNQFTDVGLDAQLEHKVGEKGGMLIGRASWIHEQQTWNAAFTAATPTTANLKNNLDTYKVNLSYIPNPTHTLTVGYFASAGSTDSLLYAPGNVTGSAGGTPNSSGAIVELTANPWLNVRTGLQYVMYQKFNGGTTNYDVGPGGRSAKDNNTLYLYLWFLY